MSVCIFDQKQPKTMSIHVYLSLFWGQLNSKRNLNSKAMDPLRSSTHLCPATNYFTTASLHQ